MGLRAANQDGSMKCRRVPASCPNLPEHRTLRVDRTERAVGHRGPGPEPAICASTRSPRSGVRSDHDHDDRSLSVFKWPSVGRSRWPRACRFRWPSTLASYARPWPIERALQCQGPLPPARSPGIDEFIVDGGFLVVEPVARRDHGRRVSRRAARRRGGPTADVVGYSMAPTPRHALRRFLSTDPCGRW